VAQDHLLWLLAELGLFEGDDLVFKGGTSLRKCRLGGAAVSGFEFSLDSTRGDGRHWALRVRHARLGQPDVPASVEFARRPPILLPDRSGFVTVPVHRTYTIDLPRLPVIAEAEACAEKLARYRRVALGRDVYDLAQFARRPLDEPLVRRLWVLKVWADVVDDGRGSRPLDPGDVLKARSERDFQPDSVGKLTQPVDLAAWERQVRTRFGFLADLDPQEQAWAVCDPRQRFEVETAMRSYGASQPCTK
jgi:predicted nucleotidyltransferase component of viral defense system